MAIPRFTAEVALYRTSRPYYMPAAHHQTDGALYPAQQFTDFGTLFLRDIRPIFAKQEKMQKPPLYLWRYIPLSPGSSFFVR
jgi:hypothetical protein